MVLIDNGSTHSFLNEGMVKKLGCEVTVANGNKVLSQSLLLLPKIQQLKFVMWGPLELDVGCNKVVVREVASREFTARILVC